MTTSEKKTADKGTIEKLNHIAEAFFNAAQGNLTTAEAIEKAANQEGFYCIFEDGDTEIYQRDDEIVNAWIGSNKFGDAFDGFDDQVEYYTDPETE